MLAIWIALCTCRQFLTDIAGVVFLWERAALDTYLQFSFSSAFSSWLSFLHSYFGNISLYCLWRSRLTCYFNSKCVFGFCPSYYLCKKHSKMVPVGLADLQWYGSAYSSGSMTSLSLHLFLFVCFLQLVLFCFFFFLLYCYSLKLVSSDTGLVDLKSV